MLQVKFCFCFDIQNNICTQHVVNLYFGGNSMNNLLSYCGLSDDRMRASEKDLPLSKSHHSWTGSEKNECSRENLMPVLSRKIYLNKSGLFGIWAESGAGSKL